MREVTRALYSNSNSARQSRSLPPPSARSPKQEHQSEGSSSSAFHSSGGTFYESALISPDEERGS